MASDAALRRTIYERTLATGVPPTIAELSATSGQVPDDVRRGLQRLAAARVVVLQPVSSELLMVPPFSAVPTPFLVKSGRHTAYANCAWDALGIAVMLRTTVEVSAACGCCGERMHVSASHDAPPAPDDCVIHFAVPAKHWWTDIVFT